MEREKHDVLHQTILKRMQALGEATPETMKKVLDDEPDLLTRYLNSCGLACTEARIVSMIDDRMKIGATMPDGHDMTCEIRFLQGA